jgi:hypothetical protein
MRWLTWSLSHAWSQPVPAASPLPVAIWQAGRGIKPAARLPRVTAHLLAASLTVLPWPAPADETQPHEQDPWQIGPSK